MIYSRKLPYDYVMDWLNKWDFPLYLVYQLFKLVRYMIMT